MADAQNTDCVSRKEFNIERDNIGEKVTALDRRITVLETCWQSWNDIPKTIQEISMTMALMQQEISALTTQMTKMDGRIEKFAEEKEKHDAHQNKRIEEIDNKSKIDLMSWVKANWFKLVVGLGMLGLLIKDLIVIK